MSVDKVVKVTVGEDEAKGRWAQDQKMVVRVEKRAGKGQ